MLQQTAANAPLEARRAWLALLARAPLEMLEVALKLLPVPRYTVLRAPETGLYMLRARIGGSGNRFNLGETTVTRCAVRLESEGTVGVGYVLGRSHRHAELVALADALLESDSHRDAVRRTLLAPVRRHLEEEGRRRARKAETTRVDFLTVSRERSPSAAPAAHPGGGDGRLEQEASK